LSAERDVLVDYWLRRSDDAYQEAELMAQMSHWNACVSRLYYACFYAVTALLRQRGQSARRHTGARSFFNREFVNAGLVSSELGNLYNQLFDQRQEADYDELVDFAENDVRGWVGHTAEFLREVRRIAGERPESSADV
jgi:uncharacterized protein (UPF0332 family)